jgi:hypothetical protein
MPKRCNCESSYCNHYVYGGGSCDQAAEGNWLMDYVGDVCDSCAARVVGTGGGAYIHPNHDPNHTGGRK